MQSKFLIGKRFDATICILGPEILFKKMETVCQSLLQFFVWHYRISQVNRLALKNMDTFFKYL